LIVSLSLRLIFAVYKSGQQYRTNNKLEILIHPQSIGHTTKAENLYGKESIHGGRIPERIKEN